MAPDQSHAVRVKRAHRVDPLGPVGFNQLIHFKKYWKIFAMIWQSLSFAFLLPTRETDKAVFGDCFDGTMFWELNQY